MSRTTRRHLLVAAALSTTLALAACGGGEDPLSGGDDNGGDADGGETTTLTIGSANFPESEIVATIYQLALEDAGYTVQTQYQIGSREAYIPALEDGSIDLIPDYTGNLLRYLDAETTATEAAEVDTELETVLADNGLEMLTPAPAESKDAVVVTEQTAQDWDLATIGDLAAYNDEVAFAGNAEFAERPSGLPGLAELYGFEPVEFVPIADGGGPATVDALTSGQVQAANIFTTSPAIPANDLVVLEDPEANFAAQNIVPVLSESLPADEIGAVLDPVSQALTTEAITELNNQVSGEERLEPSVAAEQWLTEQGLIG